MLPTHGLGYFRRHLLGSVAAKVLHDLQCPVWTTVHAEAAPAEVVPCERILCAVDLTARSRSVLDYASWLAREYGARLGIVHAPSAIDVSVAFSAGDEFQQAVLDRAAKGVETLQQQAGTSAEVFINPGSPPTIIAAAAQLFRADLLVIGRHMGEGLPGELFQSAYGILTESPCPVISI